MLPAIGSVCYSLPYILSLAGKGVVCKARQLLYLDRVSFSMSVRLGGVSGTSNLCLI